MQRLRRWQSQPPSQATVWELRRILLDSTHIRLIGFCSAKRALGRLDGESWQQWWERDLPRLPEAEAMKILLDVWNKDVWSHLQLIGAQNAAHTLARINAYPQPSAPRWTALSGNISVDSAFDALALGGFNLALAEPSLPGVETGQQAKLRDQRSRAALMAAQQSLSSRERMLSFLAFPAMSQPLPGLADAESESGVEPMGSNTIEPSGASRARDVGCPAPHNATNDGAPRA